jgi:hypothetical protein
MKIESESMACVSTGIKKVERVRTSASALGLKVLELREYSGVLKSGLELREYSGGYLKAV